MRGNTTPRNKQPQSASPAVRVLADSGNVAWEVPMLLQCLELCFGPSLHLILQSTLRQSLRGLMSSAGGVSGLERSGEVSQAHSRGPLSAHSSCSRVSVSLTSRLHCYLNSLGGAVWVSNHLIFLYPQRNMGSRH